VEKKKKKTNLVVGSEESNIDLEECRPQHREYVNIFGLGCLNSFDCILGIVGMRDLISENGESGDGATSIHRERDSGQDDTYM